MNNLTPEKKNCLRTGLFYCIKLIIISGFIFSSCTTTKNAYYFKTLPGDTSINSSQNRVSELPIRKNDVLAINFSSLNPSEDMIYNAAAGVVGTGSGAGSSGSGYFVDAQGNIQLHKLGLIHAEGMTRADLKNKIQKDIEPYLKDPIVTVRFLNHRISILGEVGQSGVINMPEERLSVLEALSSSGDIKPTGKINNILIIRETKDGKQFKRINLEDHSIFTSEWYYLLPDDIVYIEPNEKKLNEEKRNKTQQTVSIILTGVTFAFIILDRIIK